MKLFKKKVLAASITSLLLTACGGTGQDQGSADNSVNQVFSGVAVDGHLARATVFLDTNNDGTRNPWEPFAFTDNDGYYSFNPRTNTNYCDAEATAEQAQYCLRSNTQRSDVVVRIDGGYDVLTGEPFAGQMSRRIENAGDEEERTNSVISPITSLLSNVESSSDRSTLLSSMNISEADLNVDYLNTDGSGGVDVSLLNKALKIHKVVAVLSDRLTDTYTEIGEELGTPNDASSSIYPNLAEQIINSGTGLDAALSDDSTLITVMDAAEDSLRSVYENRELTLPADMGSASNPGNFQRVVNIASELGAVVDSVVDTSNAGFDLDDATGGARALESVVIKTINEGGSNDATINNALNFFTDNSAANQTLVDALVGSLASESADVSGLSNNDFNGTDFDSVDEVSQSAALPADVAAFTQVGGMQLRVSDLDLGSPNDLRDIELEAYFNGSATDISGSFKACVKYIDGAKANGDLGDGNTRGELVEGFWSLLGASEGNVESYSLLLTITFLGTTYQSIMKPAGTITINGEEVHQVRFDYDGDIGIWNSPSGLVGINSVPTTNAECETRLPSRIGI